MIASRSGTPLIDPGNREEGKGTEATKRRWDASASDLRRPPAVGNAETLRMIAPDPDDRTGKPWWTFGSNRAERMRRQGGLRAGRAKQTAMGEALSGGSTGTVAKRGTSRDDPNGAKRELVGTFGSRRGSEAGKEGMPSGSSTGTVRSEERREAIRA